MNQQVILLFVLILIGLVENSIKYQVMNGRFKNITVLLDVIHVKFDDYCSSIKTNIG